MESLTGRSSGTQRSLSLVISVSPSSVGRHEKIAGDDDAHPKGGRDGERRLNIEIVLDDLLACLI